MSETSLTIHVSDSEVNDLVERFYAKLTTIPYYTQMFNERHVDLELLKERQRGFIKRLVNGDSLDHNGNEVKQVQERHSFHTTAERAQIWLDTMEETIKEMSFSLTTEEALIEKMRFLTQQVVK